MDVKNLASAALPAGGANTSEVLEPRASFRAADYVYQAATVAAALLVLMTAAAI